MTKMPITMTEVRGKNVTRHGHVHEGTVLENTTVEIEEGVSITIMTVIAAGSRYVKDANVIELKTGQPKYVPCEEHLVTKTYKIGDTAKVGAYNLVYMGKVTKITAKTVTVVQYDDEPGMRRTSRFDIHDFAVKNATFDADEASERNHDMMMTL